MSHEYPDVMQPRIIAFCGGVGGAKLAHGLAQKLPPEDLMIVVNTGDDFVHCGMKICPDIDTVTYTLAGLHHPTQGWGRRDETWNSIEIIRQLGGPTWFAIGDKDIALHIERTRRLAAGQKLSDVTLTLSQSLGVSHPPVPMTDSPVETMLDTDVGRLSFQEYFVRQRCQPRVLEIGFHGAEGAQPCSSIKLAMENPRLEGIVICPSNPLLSLDPILAVPGIQEALRFSNVPVVMVSPIITGKAIKGPTVKLFKELGIEQSALACAKRYADFLDHYIMDFSDQDLLTYASDVDFCLYLANILMQSNEDKTNLATEILALIAELSNHGDTVLNARAGLA